jgi:hypothetical protein
MKGDREPGGQPPVDAPSLDPRTWARAPSAGAGETPGPAGDTPNSFDPRSWGRSAPSTTDKADASAPAGIDRRWLLLGGGVATLAAGGLGVTMFLARDKAALTSDTAPTAPALRTDDENSYTAPAVDGYRGLEERLANYRVPPEEIRAAVDALRPVAGADPGRMHLILRLRNAASDRPGLMAAELRRAADGAGFQLTRQGDGFSVSVLAAELMRRLIAHPRGQVNRDGLYASAVDSLSADLMTQFGEALAFDFDIAQEVREGDQFEVVHQEQHDARGNVVGSPRLLFAFMSAGGKDRYLYRFTPPGADEGWFDDRGRNTKRAFMRTPLDGARITSLFGERKHPVFHDIRMHKGVDFGCGIGTHIFAAADGVVDYAGAARGFGVLLKLKHEGGLETWYGHLSGFPAGIEPGIPVKQGQLVALSGNIGVSSGPHLHYEVHKDGVAVDPKDYLDVQGAMAGAAAMLEGAVLDAFMALKDEIDLARRSQA